MTYLVEDLNGDKIIGTFHEKKTKQIFSLELTK